MARKPAVAFTLVSSGAYGRTFLLSPPLPDTATALRLHDRAPTTDAERALETARLAFLANPTRATRDVMVSAAESVFDERRATRRKVKP